MHFILHVGASSYIDFLFLKMSQFTKWCPVVTMIAINQAFAISNILLKKILNEGIDHLVFITYRQSMSAIFLSPLAFILERRNRPKLTFSTVCYLFLSALVGVSVSQYLFLIGMQYTSATFSCAFLNLVPVITFLMALPFRLETLSLRSITGRAKIFGSLVCLVGAIFMSVYKGMPLFRFSGAQQDTEMKPESHTGQYKWVIGSIAMLAGTICWSSWFIIQTKVGNRYPCKYSSTAVMACFSALQSAVLSLCVDREFSVWSLKTTWDIFIVMYTGAVGSGLCFVGMSWCVKNRGPVFTAAFSPLVQIMAAMLDVPIFHEQIHLGSLIGSIVVMTGLYILLWGKDKEMQEHEPKTVQGAQEMTEKEPDFQPVKIWANPEHP